MNRTGSSHCTLLLPVVVWLVAFASAVMGEQALSDEPALGFRPIPPCRIFDSRASVEGALGVDESRTLEFRGGGDLSFQGGEAAGCPLPPEARVALLRLHLDEAEGPGEIRIWPAEEPAPTAPFAAIDAGSPLSSEVTVPLCGAESCDGDLEIAASRTSTQAWAEIVGYYYAPAAAVRSGTRPAPGPAAGSPAQPVDLTGPSMLSLAGPAGASTIRVERATFAFVTIGPSPTPSQLVSRTFLSPLTGVARLAGRGFCNLTPLIGTYNTLNIAAGASPVEAFAAGDFENWGVLNLPPGSVSALHQFGWTSERDVPVVAGMMYTFVLAGRHESGNTSSTCTGSFTIDLFPDTLEVALFVDGFESGGCELWSGGTGC